MKSLLKFFLGQVGYRLVKENYLRNLVHVNKINSLDFYFILQNLIRREERICCFDIGANIGQTAKKIRGYFPNSTIYSFEPVKETFEILVEQVKGHENIKAYNFALGREKGEKELFLRENSEWNSLNSSLNEFVRKKGGPQETVEIETVDNFVNQHGISKIHFFKSDTEGFEMEVLKGAQYCLESKLIDTLYLEVGFDRNDSQHTFIGKVIEELEKYDYGLLGLFEKIYAGNNMLLYANSLFIKRGELNII